MLRNCPRASSQLPGSCVNKNRVATIHIVPLMVEQDDANQLGSSDQPKNDNLGDFVGSLAPQRDADINVGLLGDGGSTEHRTENKQHVAEEVQESMTLRFCRLIKFVMNQTNFFMKGLIFLIVFISPLAFAVPLECPFNSNH